jgi:short-subunit dehydrogenase
MERCSILRGKNCFIIGATGGIGWEIAKNLAANGCNLFLTSRTSSKLKDLKRELEIDHPAVMIGETAADLAKIENIEDAAKTAISFFRKIDILINCAGIFKVKSLSESTISDFEDNVYVNLRSAFVLSKIFSEQMKSSGWGRIVNIGSSSCYGGAENTSLYCMSKHGLLGLSRALAVELKKDNIRVFCISPSGTKTKMGLSIPNQNFETFLNPAEIAEYLSFVISFDGELISDEIMLKRINMGG